jgi:hypothetical protein
VDEAGFNLAKTHHWRRNVIVQRVTVDVPGTRGGKITMCYGGTIDRLCYSTFIASNGCFIQQDRVFLTIVSVFY